MLAKYHVAITTDALAEQFDAAGLQVIIRANLRQDSLLNQLDPALHFDDSAFAAGEAYIQEQRALAVAALRAGSRQHALAAFGRLLHTRQDFYAHSNWVQLWVARNGGLEATEPEAIEICTKPLQEPALRSGRASAFWYVAVRLPLFGRWFQTRVPADSHEAMNLDHPGRGPYFRYALAAARKHTRQEFGLLLAEIGKAGDPTAVHHFLGQLPQPLETPND